MQQASSTSMDERLFHEVQPARLWWISLLVVGLVVMAWGILIQQVVRGKPVGENPMSDWGVVFIWLIFGVGLPLLVWHMRMETEVRPDGIVIRWVPITRRVIRRDEIMRVEAKQYRPLREFGGWGVRGWPSSGKRAYSVSGNEGVEVRLEDGKAVMIGSQRAEELAEAIRRMVDGR